MKRRKLLRHLAQHRCTVLREGGSHTIVYNLANGNRSQVPRHAEIKPSIARAICQDLGIPVPAER